MRQMILVIASMGTERITPGIPRIHNQKTSEMMTSYGIEGEPSGQKSRALSAGRFECGGTGTARLMSHHMGNFVHARDDEYLPVAACLAFERAAFDVSCVQRLDQPDQSLPAACGA
jgi:hypothetical protein